MHRDARNLAYCTECAQPFNVDRPILLMSCGHSICKVCKSTLSGDLYFCIACKGVDVQTMPEMPYLQAAASQLALGMKAVTVVKAERTSCNSCSVIDLDWNMTICHTCSSWKQGDHSVEHTDFAKRPVKQLMCFKCANASHVGHNVMKEEVVKGMWYTLPNIANMEKYINEVEMLMDWGDHAMKNMAHFSALTQKGVSELRTTVENSEFSIVTGAPNIIQALDNISFSYRNDQKIIRQLIANSRRRANYVEKLQYFVNKTQAETKTCGIERPRKDDEITDFNVIIERHVKELDKVLAQRELEGEVDEEATEQAEKPMETAEVTDKSEKAAEQEDDVAQPVVAAAPQTVPRPTRKTTRQSVPRAASVDSETTPRKRGRREGTTDPAKAPRSANRRRGNKKDVEEESESGQSSGGMPESTTAEPLTASESRTSPVAQLNSTSPAVDTSMVSFPPSLPTPPSVPPQNPSTPTNLSNMTPLMNVEFGGGMDGQHSNAGGYPHPHSDYYNPLGQFGNGYQQGGMQNWNPSAVHYPALTGNSNYSTAMTSPQQMMSHYNNSNGPQAPM